MTSPGKRSSPTDVANGSSGTCCANRPRRRPPARRTSSIPLGQTRDARSSTRSTRRPICAGCHDPMDQAGVALEEFDELGRFRTVYGNNTAIDTHGTFAGVSVNGEAALAAAVGGDPRLLPCVSRKLLSFAVNRALVDSDTPYAEPDPHAVEGRARPRCARSSRPSSPTTPSSSAAARRRERALARHVLRGAGVALALPWLESLAPRRARGQSGAAALRFVPMYFPLGRLPGPDFWTPSGTGAGDAWQLSPILEPLAPIKSQVTVLEHVDNTARSGRPRRAVATANLTGAFLTCTRPRPRRRRQRRRTASRSTSSSRGRHGTRRRCRSGSRRSTRTATACRARTRAASRGPRPASRSSSSSTRRACSTRSSAARRRGAVQPRHARPPKERPRHLVRPRGEPRSRARRRPTARAWTSS